MSGYRFFFDRSCPRRIARVIAAFDETNEVRFLDDDIRFTDRTADIDWLTVLAADPLWAVVSMDGKILTRSGEWAAVRGTGLKFFLLGKGWMAMSMHAKAWRLLKTWPNVVEAAYALRSDVFEVSAGGSHKVEPLRR